ncbi:MAG TPA: D-2-hydroxyacid dehydrogenase [Methylomirabilota bacterium]|nr:D-2-hydroxyacid dehydrogenase [Methylomirabilota bacterium]
MSSRIWIRLDLPERELRSLRDSFPDCEFYRGKDGDTDAQHLQQIDAVFTEEPLPDNLTSKMTALKWLHVTRGGVNTYLTPSIKYRPLQVTGSKGIHGGVFSEFALACIFALAKKLPQCIEAQRQARWQQLAVEEVAGKTLGIVGLGTVGSELARKANALGLRVIATKRTATVKPEYVDQLGGPEYLPALLSQSDFVVLCLASIPSTENIIGEAELRAMKKSSYLINLTGGMVIEERLLVQALKEGWIAGAALDAFPRQPLPGDSELWRLPNVIISARIGGIPTQKWPQLLPIFIDNLKRFLAGEPLRNVVDKELGY